MIVTGLAVGVALGIVMQRGRFCVTGMLRDIFTLNTWRSFVALLVVISIHAVGIAALTNSGIISPDYKGFAPIATIVGGFVFGLGIVLAGGCASGTWYRSGEGLVGSWIALFFYALSSAMMKTGALSWLNSGLRSYQTDLTTIPASLGISVWWFVLGLSALTIYLVNYFLQKEAATPQVARLHVSRSKRPLHIYTAGALVGIFGVIAWPLSAATGRNDGLGITTPSSNLINYLVRGDGKYFDWGVLLVLGILAGSFIAAKCTGEFRLRVPDARQALRSVFGGLLMGIGAAAAGGCTVGNGMVQTSLFTYQGWTALLFIALGVGAGAKLWLKPSKVAASNQQAEAPQSSATVQLPSDDSSEIPVGNPESASVFDASSYSVVSAPVALKVRVPEKQGLRQLEPNKYALDTLGAVCPFPLVEARDVMNDLSEGDELVIDFDCTQATETIPRWAADEGYEVTDFHATGDAGWQITVRK